MESWSAKAPRTTSGPSSWGSTTGDSATKTWNESTSRSTIPSTNAYRACGNCPTVAWVHVTELYTAEELKTSPTYNEALPRAQHQNGLTVRLDGPDDASHISWGLGDPVASDGWGSSEIAMIKKLMPHIRQFIRVRQTLVRAETRNTTVSALLDNPRIGVLHLDRRGRIMEINDRASSILRQGDGLSDQDGVLRAREPADRLRLDRLVASALPASGAVAVSGSMLLGRSSGLPPLVLHVQTRCCSTTGLRSAARRRADTDYRAEESASDRPRPGGQDPGADADGEPGSGLVGRKARASATWPRPRGTPQAPSIGN